MYDTVTDVKCLSVNSIRQEIADEKAHETESAVFVSNQVMGITS